MKTQIKQWLSTTPKTISQEQRRIYNIAVITSLGGAISHFVMLLLFATFHVNPMFYFNIFSVTLFTAAFIFIRRTGLATQGMLIMTIELVLHQALAVYFLGWGYGYQYYLFGIAGFAYLGHYRHRIIPKMLVLMSGLLFAWLYAVGQHLYSPHFTMPDSVRIFLFWMNVLSAANGIALTSRVYRITAERMEQELADQNRELRETQMMLIQSEKMAAIGKLAAGLTHEINNPIGAILSSTQTGSKAVDKIREWDGEPGEETRQKERMVNALRNSIDSTATAAQRLSELVGRLQGFIHIDEAEVKSVDLHKGIESTVSLLGNLTAEDPINVMFEFDRSIPNINCRPAEINQVFMHLLQNSVDAIEGSGTIKIKTSQDKTHVMIAIQDTGRGMNKEECDSLFDLSFSGRSRIKLGMGLPISQQIINRHNGEIHVKSKPGQGSTFTVILPKENAM